jgi:hypothetical protein
MTALAKAIKLPITEPAANTGRGGRNQVPAVSYLFNDVNSTMPEYPYIMAIYNSGIAVGRDTGDFEFEKPIQRQEAFTVLVRALGLSILGMDPTAATFFVDDTDLAGWAKREVAVANMLGLISTDANGRIRPKDLITKGEAAALLNTFIEYMRNGLVSDYGEQIVNLPN